MPLKPALTGGWVAFAAGLIPAFLMQFACMQISSHIITHHLIPTLLVGVVGLLAGAVMLKPSQPKFDREK